MNRIKEIVALRNNANRELREAPTEQAARKKAVANELLQVCKQLDLNDIKYQANNIEYFNRVGIAIELYDLSKLSQVKEACINLDFDYESKGLPVLLGFQKSYKWEQCKLFK